jgi:hypothetical protein
VWWPVAIVEILRWWMVDGPYVRFGVGPHLTSTKKKRRRKDGNATNHLHQGYCTVCSSKLSMFARCVKMLEGRGGLFDVPLWYQDLSMVDHALPVTSKEA